MSALKVVRQDKNETILNDTKNDTFTTAILYTRVSTSEQSTARQTKDLLSYCRKNNLKIKEQVDETISGTIDWKQRKIAASIYDIQCGECLLTCEPSRIARQVGDLLGLCDFCVRRGAGLIFLSPNIRFDGSAMGRALLSIIGVVGELERNILKERQASSISLIKQQIEQNGKYTTRSGKVITRLGRPIQDKYSRKLDAKRDKLESLLQHGFSITDCARMLEVSRKTIYDFMASRNVKR